MKEIAQHFNALKDRLIEVESHIMRLTEMSLAQSELNKKLIEMLSTQAAELQELKLYISLKEKEEKPIQ